MVSAVCFTFILFYSLPISLSLSLYLAIYLFFLLSFFCVIQEYFCMSMLHSRSEKYCSLPVLSLSLSLSLSRSPLSLSFPFFRPLTLLSPPLHSSSLSLSLSLHLC